MSTTTFSDSLVESINSLNDQQKKRFEKELKHWLDQKNQVKPIDNEAKYKGVLLTTAQARLYEMCSTELGFRANLVSQKVTLKGELFAENLIKSLLLVTERHPAFRTIFKLNSNKHPLQWINSKITHDVEQYDFENSKAPNSELADLEKSHRNQFFNLEQGPLFRFSLAKLNASTHVLLFTTHNLVFDAWSYDIFIKELKHFYNKSLTEEKPQIARNTIDFLDYVKWNENWVNDKRYKNQLNYWEENLNFPHCDDLVIDIPRDAKIGRTFSGKRLDFSLPISIKSRLEEISKSNGATLFMTSLAAITAFFSSTMNMRNICIGTISANRARPEVENIIGYFLNITPIHTKVEPKTDSIVDTIAKIKTQSLAAIENTDVYSESLTHDSNLTFDPLRNPFFDILFSFESLQDNDAPLNNIEEHYQDLDKGTARYDLTISLYDDNKDFYGWLEYNESLFEEDTANRLASELTTWLEKASLLPEATVENLSKAMTQ